ncbi:hypothetical protein [Paenibacillus sp. y28]
MFEGSDIMGGITFWIVMLVFAMFIVAMLTASYNDDKTQGL